MKQAIPDAIAKTYPLHAAAHNGDLSVVTALLKRGACVDAKTNDGFTPLHFAALVGHQPVVTALLARGACVDAKGDNGFPPLYSAAPNGHQPVVKVLLEGGACVDAKTNDGFTPLHFAALVGHQPVVTALLEGGACVDAKDNDGFTPLHFAAPNGHLPVVTALLEGGACVDAKDNDGFTPLHFAAPNGHLPVVTALLARGACVDAKGDNGFAPLHAAFITGCTEAVRLLYTHGAADIDDGQFQTAVGSPSYTEEQKTEISALRDQAKVVHNAFSQLQIDSEFNEFQIDVVKGLCRNLGYVPQFIIESSPKGMQPIIEEANNNYEELLGIICTASEMGFGVLPAPGTNGFVITKSQEQRYNDRAQSIRKDITSLDPDKIRQHLISSSQCAAAVIATASNTTLLWPESVFDKVIKDIRIDNARPYANILAQSAIEENAKLRQQMAEQQQQLDYLMQRFPPPTPAITASLEQPNNRGSKRKEPELPADASSYVESRNTAAHIEYHLFN